MCCQASDAPVVSGCNKLKVSVALLSMSRDAKSAAFNLHVRQTSVPFTATSHDPILICPKAVVDAIASTTTRPLTFASVMPSRAPSFFSIRTSVFTRPPFDIPPGWGSCASAAPAATLPVFALVDSVVTAVVQRSERSRGPTRLCRKIDARPRVFLHGRSASPARTATLGCLTNRRKSAPRGDSANRPSPAFEPRAEPLSAPGAALPLFMRWLGWAGHQQRWRMRGHCHRRRALNNSRRQDRYDGAVPAALTHGIASIVVDDGREVRVARHAQIDLHSRGGRT